MFTVPSNSSAGSETLSRAAPLAVYAAAFIVVVSAISLCLLLHEHDAVGRAGYRTTDVDQVALGIDALDAKMRLRVTMRAIVSGHLLALDDARRISARSDRSRPSVLRVSMGVRTAAKAVTLHDSLESASFRSTGHLHLIARRKDSNGD